MKSKYLKTYENYKTGYLNDNEEENTEEKMESSEEVDNDSENVEDSVEIEVKVKTASYEEDCDITETEVEISPKTEVDLPISTGFNPNDNFTITPKAEWCIIKCMTNNGERLGIDKQSETDCEVVCNGLHYDDAVAKVEEFSRKCNCQAFDNDCDVYLGKISKYFIKKPVKSSGGFDGIGSYK